MDHIFLFASLGATITFLSIMRASTDSISSKSNQTIPQTTSTSSSRHLLASACSCSATAFWLFAQAMATSRDNEQNYEEEEYYYQGTTTMTTLIKDSASVMALCFILENAIQILCPACERHYVLVHYTLGLIQLMSYLVSYLIGVDTFNRIWQPIFFGYYMWTNVLLVAKPNVFFPKFCTFYFTHHTMSFFVTGTWALVPGGWEQFISRGAMLWFTSGTYDYVLSIYRAIYSSQQVDMALYRKLRIGVFWLERIHRVAAYVQAFVLTKGFLGVSVTGWIVFGTTMVMDILDTYFQVNSLLSNPSGKSTVYVDAVRLVDTTILSDSTTTLAEDRKEKTPNFGLNNTSPAYV